MRNFILVSRSTAPVWAALVVLLGLAVPASADLKIDSQPLEQAVIIDGETADWAGVRLAFLEDSVHFFAVAHDADTLYLMWRFSDQRRAREVLARGVTVWLNGNGKRARDFGLRYAGSQALAKALQRATPPSQRADRPDGPDRGFGRSQPPDGPPGGDGPPRDMPAGEPDGGVRRRLEPGTLTVIDGGETRVLPESSEHGPRAASAVHEGVYGYELAIPLSWIGGKLCQRPASRARSLRIGIGIGDLSDSEHQGGPERGGRARVRMGAGGGMGGGGMGGGMGGGPMGGGMGGGPMGGGMGGGPMGGGMGGGPRGGGPRGGERAEPGRAGLAWLKVRLPAIEAPGTPSAQPGPATAEKTPARKSTTAGGSPAR